MATVAVAVAEVGTALSVVGAVTGNSTLTKIGGVMGLAGGAVGLASGAFSGAADAAASAGTDAGTSAGADAAASGVADTGTGAITSAVADPAADITTTVLPDATSGVAGAADAGSSGIVNSAMTPAAGSPAASGVASSTDATSGLDNSIVNPDTGTGATPAASNASPTPESAPAPTIPTAPPVASVTTAPTTATQINNLTPGEMSGTSANLTQGQAIPGVNAPTPSITPAEGVGSNDILDTSSAQNGTSYGTGAGTNGAPSASGNFFSGLTNWIKSNPTAARVGGQLVSGAMSGVGQAYQAQKQYELGAGQLAINQQKQSNANAQVASGGIINTARKPKG